MTVFQLCWGAINCCWGKEHGLCFNQAMNINTKQTHQHRYVSTRTRKYRLNININVSAPLHQCVSAYQNTVITSQKHVDKSNTWFTCWYSEKSRCGVKKMSVTTTPSLPTIDQMLLRPFCGTRHLFEKSKLACFQILCTSCNSETVWYEKRQKFVRFRKCTSFSTNAVVFGLIKYSGFVIAPKSLTFGFALGFTKR